MSKEKTMSISGFDMVMYPCQLWVVVNGDIEGVNQAFEDCDGKPFTESPAKADARVMFAVEKETGLCGAMIYTREKDIAYDVIAHEAVHAADAVFDYICAYSQSFQDGNEPYAYLVGWIFKQTCQGIKNFKTIKNNKK
jgi:hypothetical protein